MRLCVRLVAPTYFAPPRLPSSYIPCWTCAARFQPSFTSATASCAIVNVLDILLVEAGSFYIMDRGYLDFVRLYAMQPINQTSPTN